MLEYFRELDMASIPFRIVLAIVGIGFYEGAVLGSLAIVFTVSGLHGFDNWMRKNSRYLEVYLGYNNYKYVFRDFLQYMKENNFEITNIQVSRVDTLRKEKEKQNVSYILTVKSEVKRSHAEMMDMLSQAKGIQYIEEL